MYPMIAFSNTVIVVNMFPPYHLSKLTVVFKHIIGVYVNRIYNYKNKCRVLKKGHSEFGMSFLLWWGYFLL